VDSIPGRGSLCSNFGQAIHTYMPLLPSSNNMIMTTGSDALREGGQFQTLCLSYKGHVAGFKEPKGKEAENTVKQYFFAAS